MKFVLAPGSCVAYVLVFSLFLGRSQVTANVKVAVDAVSDENIAAMQTRAHEKLRFLQQCQLGVNTITATFVHEVLHPGYSYAADSSEAQKGTIQVNRKRQFKMTYDTLPRRVIVSDGQEIKAYNEQTRTVYKQKAVETWLNPLLNIWFGKSYKKTFIPRLVHQTSAKKRGTFSVLELIPQGRYSLFKKVVLTLKDQCPALRRIVMIDREDTAVRISFSNIKTNVPLAKKSFRLPLSKGAKIIRP